MRQLLIPLILLLLLSCENWTALDALEGSWSSTQKVTVRLKDSGGEYRFVSSTIPIQLVIHQSGSVTGTVGAAVLEECMVESNRGWIGRTLNLNTDFIAIGELSGAIFVEDTYAHRSVSVPFNLESDTLRGSIFHLEGMGSFPMVSIALGRN